MQTATASPSTVKGPTTPTVDEPGDNEPALVLGGFGLGALALAGAFVVAPAWAASTVSGFVARSASETSGGRGCISLTAPPYAWVRAAPR